MNKRNMVRGAIALGVATLAITETASKSSQLSENAQVIAYDLARIISPPVSARMYQP